MSLYQNLFKYRERPARSPREDFLTEALADLLNRIPQNRQIEFCAEFFLKGQGAIALTNWKTACHEVARNNAPNRPGHATFRWSTQRPITAREMEGRPDLILYAGDTPILVIENKIDACFTNNQLGRYRAWIQSEFPHSDVVLLTHLTEAPEGFLYRTWADVHRLLVSTGKDYWRESNPSAASLIDEFVRFLEEIEMAHEDPTGNDLAAARLYFTTEADQRIDAALAAALKICRPRLEKEGWSECSWDETKVDRKEKNILLWGGGWDSRRNKANQIPGWGVYWGFFFGQRDQSWWRIPYSPRIPIEEGVFVYLTVPGGAVPKDQKWPRADEWHFPSEVGPYKLWEVVRVAETSHFLCAPERFTESFVNWVLKNALTATALRRKLDPQFAKPVPT